MFCANCHVPARFLCSRCNSEFYCSKQCQINDFITHRMNCFSLPALKRVVLNEPDVLTSLPQSPTVSERSSVNPDPVVEEQSKTEESAGKDEKESRVFISDLKTNDLPVGKIRVTFLHRESNSNMFNCYEASPEIEGYFKYIEKEIFDYCKTQTPGNYKPGKKEVVLALFKGTFYRAVCLGKNGDSFTVHFIDYGNKADVKIGEMMPLSPNLKFDIVVRKVLVENFPAKLTSATAKILDDELGVPIEIEKKHDEGYFVAKICGIPNEDASSSSQKKIKTESKKADIEQNVTENIKLKAPEEEKEGKTKKNAITPAFNQGIRTVPPNIASKPIQSAVKEPAAEKPTEVAKSFRRNQKFSLSEEAPKPKTEKIFINDLECSSLPLGKIKVNIFNGEPEKKKFFCAEASPRVKKSMDDIEAKIHHFLKTDKTERYAPEIDEVVLALDEGSYFRAICLDKKDDEFEMFFIDYGNSSVLKATEIKPMPSTLKNDIYISQIYMENFPKVITREISELLNNDEGLLLDVLKHNSETNCYVAKICAL